MPAGAPLPATHQVHGTNNDYGAIVDMPTRYVIEIEFGSYFVTQI